MSFVRTLPGTKIRAELTEDELLRLINLVESFARHDADAEALLADLTADRPHTPVGAGQCLICGHYGSDCIGTL